MANLFTRLFTRNLGQTTLRLQTQMIGIGSAEIYADINASNVIQKGFSSNTSVYSIVMTDADKFGSIPRYLMAEDGTKIEDHPLNTLLERPNTNEGQDAFFTKARAYFKVCGETFLWCNRGFDDGTLTDLQWSRRPILEMHVLPSDMMILVPDPEDIFDVLGYKLDFAGTKIPFRKTDIIHWKNTNLNFDASRSHLRGVPPLGAGFRTLTQSNTIDGSFTRMYQNDGSKGILSNSSHTKLSPEGRNKVEQVVDAKLNYNDTKGSVAVLEGKWDYTDLRSSIDLNLLEAKKMSWQELCFLLKVPVVLFQTDTTFSNTEQAIKSWISNTIGPACTSLDGEMNRVLLPAFSLDGRAFIQSDISELPEMQDDIGKLIESLSKAPITINEFREAIKYQRIENPLYDQIMIPASMTPASDAIQGDGFAQMNQQLQQRLQQIRPTNGVTTNS